ncbi:MAG: hypothetical protein EPN47_14155 [Acidobacteria bacterium]|nr:MAG: hypothetical protein EPN47_14155 [Acidobacteriota bacterium]
MKRPRLDVSALCNRRWPRLPRTGFSITDLLDNQSQFSLTRREMLGLAGTAAASLPLKFGAPEGRLQFIPGNKRVAFRLDGRERWAIDTRRFSGTPALHVAQRKNLVHVALVNARYPGTELPAGLECKLEPVAAGWRMHLRMELGGFQGEALFERWLAGKAKLRSDVRLDKSIAGPGNSSRLLLAGRAQAEFMPNWTIRLAGKGIARLSGFGGETVSDSVAIALLDPDEPSILRKPPERRTLLAMYRHGRPWPFEPVLGAEDASNLMVSDSAFDRIQMEAGEDFDGASSQVLLADSQVGRPGIAFIPAGNFGASDGKPFRLPLRNARYAITTDASGQQAAIVANYPSEPLWVHAEGCSFEIGSSADDHTFEAVSVNGSAPRIRCAPGLNQIAAPLPGVIVQARPLQEGTQLAFLEPPQTWQEQIIPGKIRKKEQKEQKKQNKESIRLQVQPRKKTGGALVAPGNTRGQHSTNPAEGGTQPLVPSGGSTTPGRISGAPQTNPAEGGTQPRVPPREPGTPLHIEPGSINVVLGGGQPGKQKILPHPVFQPTSEQSLSFDIIRPDDLLALTFNFYNMTLSAGVGTPGLVRVDPNQPAYLVVQFGPQHIAEEAFFESNTPQPLPRNAEPPIPSRLAGGSRLAFIIPDNVTEIPYTLESLLNWSQFELSVTPLATPPKPFRLRYLSTTGLAKTAREPQVQAIQSSPEYYQQVQPPAITTKPAAPDGKNKKRNRNQQSTILAQREITQAQFAGGLQFLAQQIKEPEVFQTALEVPYRIILSPSYYAGWAHSLKPVEHGGATELWHTRLGVRFQQGKVDEQDEYYRTVRAVWATDYQAGCLPAPQTDTTPFATPTINARQRYEIVRLSSDPTITTVSNAAYEPQPIQVNRLMLSTIGAWMNTDGVWEPPEDVREPACPGGKFSFNVESWRHIAAMGRDQYVRIVERGYLFPFGHRAVKIVITERKFDRTPSGDMAAYLRQQIFVVVREREKSYPATGQPHPQGPQIPFQTVRIDTLSTPALDQPVSILPGDAAFWPRVDNQDFQFKMVGVDWEGNKTEFTAPLIFVIADSARNMQQSSTILNSYNSDPDSTRRVRPFFGQKVAYAKNKLPGDTAFETDSMSFTGEVPENPQVVPTGQPYFYPAISQSAVRIATVEQLTGRNAATDIAYDATYLAHGIEAAANQGQVFAKLLNSIPLAFGGSGGGSDKVGGLLTPSMDISGLSRLLGPVAGDLATITGGTFDPKQFFNSAMGAKLLGDISLSDVINSVSNFSSAVEKVPKFITSQLPNAVQTSFTWQPEVQDASAGAGQPAFFKVTGDRSQALTVNATLTKTLDNNPPSYEVSAVLKTFEVHLVPSVIEVLVIKFKKLSFKSINGKKPDVSADLDAVEFAGPLSFINGLKDLIPTDGFNDPPSLDVTPQGIEMGYSLGLPPVSIGLFNLSNVSLAARLNIYFTGDPITFEFDFCQEEQPFLLTVSLFGGGGYFGLTLTPAGIRRMAAEFEFGGSFSLNLGVASGGVYVMAGFSYAYTNGDTELTGYLRCGGSLEVLAIITVSVEFKMGLTYLSAGNKVWGRATLTVEVKVLFFSQSVDLTVEREFAGGGAQNAALYGAGAPYPVGAGPVNFADQMSAADWQLYCEAFA